MSELKRGSFVRYMASDGWRWGKAGLIFGSCRVGTFECLHPSLIPLGAEVLTLDAEKRIPTGEVITHEGAAAVSREEVKEYYRSLSRVGRCGVGL